MIYSSISSSFKIFAIKIEVDVDEIATFVSNSFSNQLRINIKQLIEFCNKDQMVQEFFSIIKYEPQKLPNGAIKTANYSNN